MEHTFTKRIKEILKKHFKDKSEDIYDKSELLQYINFKTKSAEKGSKARSSFANLYAIYILIEDYIKKDFHKKDSYKNYKGAEFSKLFTRQRELPFGNKLQNHALNNRMNSEFQKYFPTSSYIPILRNLETNRYWINENLIKISLSNKKYNITEPIIEIIDEYVKTKRDSFERFINNCIELQKIEKEKFSKVQEFIKGLLKPNVDARLFEIVSYSILRSYYKDQKIYWGFERTSIKEDYLKLFKTGRTNANDGGIDFVMKPLGRFFQVTETLDVKKYFLFIDKIERYPITFVVKTELSEKEITFLISKNAEQLYSVKDIVKKYMSSIEEVINIPKLIKIYDEIVKKGNLNEILYEIIRQSKVEFNYQEIE
ncbi:MAG: restriction endonuclease [Ignavibacteriaceae bacterium]